jgi:hypothetical protein
MPATQLTSKDLSQRLSRRLSSYKIKDDVISKLADRVLVDGLEIKKFDICIYGICIDYFTDRIPKLDAVFAHTDVAKLEVFPYGVLAADRFRVRVSYSVDELAGRVNGGGGF